MRELRYLAVTLIAASLAIALSSCGPSNDKEEAAPPQPAATGTATRTEVVPEQYLVNIQPQAETYEIPEDLSTVGNLAHYTELTNSQKRQLAKTGFVVVPDEAEQMFFLYEEYAETDDAANFITVDSVLQAYHIFFDYSLRTVEAMHLCQAAQEMTEALLTGSLKLLDGAPEGSWWPTSWSLFTPTQPGCPLPSSAPPSTTRSSTRAAITPAASSSRSTSAR